MNSAIRTEHLGKKFGRIEALSDLNLDVPTGTIYALVGPNGAGKTTSIKILMNIFPATCGRAEVLGADSSLLAGQSFTSIGYVSENQELPDWMQVGDFFAYLRPFYPSWDRDLENVLVRQFQLPLDRKLGKLSCGMRMKAALVSSLAYRPKLIILDEPFGGRTLWCATRLLRDCWKERRNQPSLSPPTTWLKSRTWPATLGILNRVSCESRRR